MEIKFVDGAYVADECGDFETVSGKEEILQRILFKLTAHRGGFPLLPELGSRLFLLPREKSSDRENAARQFIMEALQEEELVVLETIKMLQVDDRIELTLWFRYDDTPLKMHLEI